MSTTTTTSSSSSSSPEGQPMLPPLYFEDSNATDAATGAHTTTTTKTTDNTTDDSLLLPSELLSHCFSFANWGDLAKLACVQSSWSHLLVDAASHSVEAQWELAQALLHGSHGLSPNPGLAMILMHDLANTEVDEQGAPILLATSAIDNDTSSATASATTTECFAPAMSTIANCYFHGEGVEKDAQLGLSWLEACFTLGNDVESAHETALLYEYGKHDITVDVVAAAVWFTKAAEAGHIAAMAELGLCYELGCGVDQSDATALDWYTKAANLGCATSKFSVGEAFEEARGVPQSDEEACLWYYRAAVVGDEDSKKALRRLYDIARIVVPGVSELLSNE